MREHTSVKAGAVPQRLVAVIASPEDLQRALRLRRLPDLFEVRLDAFHPMPPTMEASIQKLPRPLIITARHPQEGGQGNLSAAVRGQLLLRFLPFADYVDVELRSAPQLQAILRAAAAKNKKRIISVHDLRRTPDLRALDELAARARLLAPDIFKIVTRTDNAVELTRLLFFFVNHQKSIPLSAMGVGKFGSASRIALFRSGSVLNYAHLGKQSIEGQPSLAQLRRCVAAEIA